MSSNDYIYLGISGFAVCLMKQNGKEIWRRKLRSWGVNLTNIIVDGETIYVYAGGHLYALDASNGTILWENGLTGLGYSYCIFGTDVRASTTAQQQSATAAVHLEEQTRQQDDRQTGK